MKNKNEKKKKEIPDNIPVELHELHERFVGKKVLMLGDHPHADRVGIIDRMERAHALNKWGFIVRFNYDEHDEAFVFEGKHWKILN
jgi:hypothetical protein